MLKVLIIISAVAILVYMLLELIIHFFEVPVLIFRIKQLVAYTISICLFGGAAASYEYKVLMLFFIAFAVYWLIKSFLDRAEFYSWIKAIENAMEEEEEG